MSDPSPLPPPPSDADRIREADYSDHAGLASLADLPDGSHVTIDSPGPIAKIIYRCDGKNLFTAYDGSFRHAIPTGFVLYGELYAVIGPVKLNEAGDGITVECVHQSLPSR